MNKKLIPFASLALVAGVVTSCGGTTTSGAKEKPLIFYNRQPTLANNSVDKEVMNWSDLTFYGGFDAVAGGDTQGKMIADYIKEHAAEMDRNGDGTIGYVLAIGQNSHNDSSARTIGIRKALGTGSTAEDKAQSQEGSVTANDGKTYKVKELAAQEMRDSAGPWSQAVAGTAMAGWINQYGDQIDLVVSNNDGMAEGMIAQYPEGLEIPTFGYDANASTLDLILEGGSMKGTITQNHHAQVLTVLQLLRNFFDGETGEGMYTKGFKTADKSGNQILSANVAYTADTKALLAENGIVTIDNAQGVKDDVLDSGIKNKTADTTKHKVLWTVYSSTDNFLNQTYIPTVERYLEYYNYDITWIKGDGTQETSVTSGFTNLNNYEAYVVNMVEPTNGALYQDLLANA